MVNLLLQKPTTGILNTPTKGVLSGTAAPGRASSGLPDSMIPGTVAWNTKYGISMGPSTVPGASSTWNPGGVVPTPSPSGYSGGGGGGGVSSGPSAAALAQIRANPLLASLETLDTILGNKNAQSQAEYQRAIDSYNAQDKLDSTMHDQNVAQNEGTYSDNNFKALLSAANASSGLKGVLASIGGLAGSGVDTVRRLIGLVTNEDTNNSRQTFNTNATNLNQAWGQAEQQQRQRRSDAQATLDNSLQDNQASVLGTRQSIYQQLADVFGAGTPQGNDYAGKAASLAAPIAATTKATVAPYTAASSLFSPTALQTYLAGTQNLNASANGASSTPINSPVYAAGKKKDALVGVA